MMHAETFVMAGGLYIARMADRSEQSGDCIVMASLAVRHAELSGNTLRRVVAGYAIHHLGQSQVRKTVAMRNVGVACSAFEIEFLLHREMSNVSELDVDILTRDRGFGDHAAFFGETGILDFLRCVAADAAIGIQRGCELRLHAGLGVASRALRVPREFREDALLVEFMTEGTVGTKAGREIFAALLVHVIGM